MKKKSQINRMLFYFITEETIEEKLETRSVTNKKNQSVCIWKREKGISNELILEVKKLMDESEQGHVLSTFTLDKNYFNAYELDFTQAFLLPKNQLEKIGFKINAIRIHCFQSRINFFELDYIIDSDDAKVINDFNYFLSEVKSKIQIQLVYKRINEEKQIAFIEKTTSILDVILKVISEFGPLNDMDYNGQLSYKSLKPTLISYLYDEKNETKDEVNLGHNYKSSYQLNDQYVRKSQYFNNSTWYYTPDSVTNISHSTDNEVTNAFFKETFLDKVNHLYFPLVLLALHQKIYLLDVYHRLMNMHIQFANADELKEKCNELTLLKADYNKMSVYYFMDNPSFIEHVNVFYSNVVAALNIDSYQAMVTKKMQRLSDFSNECSILLADYKEKKEAKRKIIYDIFGIVTASIISFASLYDSFLKFFSNINVELSVSLNVSLFLVLVLLCLLIPLVVNLTKNVKKYRKTKKAIQETEKKITDFGFIKKI